MASGTTPPVSGPGRGFALRSLASTATPGPGHTLPSDLNGAPGDRLTSERFIVIGAGIIGLATAREIRHRHPDAEVTVVDKEAAVGRHQTGHNSGVVHAGLYYAPGSLKARLCTRGRQLLREFCETRDLDYEECGKLVVACGDGEVPALREIEARAQANGVPGLRWLDATALRDIEPHAAGVAALHSPHTAIVDFKRVAEAMGTELDVRLGFEVTELRGTGREVLVGGPAGELRGDRVVVCAGLQADRVARLAGDQAGPAIVAFRGEYWRLVPERAHLVRGLIYPVPDPAYPFLGVHFTRRVGGVVDLGPNAVLALAREGYRRRDVRVADVRETLAWPGFRKLTARHWRPGLRELRGSLSKRAFIAEARRLVPEVTAADVMPAPTGVRAQAVDVDGALVDDFRIGSVGGSGRILTVRNAPSPGATSSLAIAEYLVDEMDRILV
jgi:L-2-hydroxyglutarate oxidase LhgO